MLTFFRTLGIGGTAGLVVSIVLATLLVLQKGETRHWHKQSDGFEKLYHAEQDALTKTELNYRRATDQARAADKANADRVAAEQQTINERTLDDYQARIADARAAAQRLRDQLAAAAAHPGSGGAAPVPGVHPASVGPTEAASGNGLSVTERLIATEQAIQLDELIRWVQKQAAIRVNGEPTAPVTH